MGEKSQPLLMEHMTVEDQCVCEGHAKCVFTVIPI